VLTEPVTAPAAAPEPRNEGLVALTIAIILLNVLFQVVTFVAARAGAIEPSTGIRWSLYLTCGFYAVVLGIAVSKARTVGFRPVWTEGDPTEAAVVGAAIGAGVAVGIMLVGRLLAGHVVVDPRVALIVSEHTFGRVAAAVLLIVITAPVVEELLFRGLVVESLRHRGVSHATTSAALLFAFWHLSPAALVYYFGLGMLLGRLYWKRGLKSSIAAHGAFNGCIVVAALAVAIGPSHTLAAAGASVQVPAAWHRTATPAGGPAVLAATGPSGASFALTREAIPPSRRTPDLQQVADRVNQSGLVLPGVEVGAGSARVVTEPFGQAVRMSVRSRGHAGEVVVAIRDDAVWTVVLVSGGSGQAQRDFEGILRRLHLP
jgi:membrane protease YdiL (CAAX protease family)